MPVNCVSCYQEITGRVIHDNGAPCCEPCRKSLIAQRAEKKADRLIAANLDGALVLAEIQQKRAA